MPNNLRWAQVVAGSNPAAPTILTRHPGLARYPPVLTAEMTQHQEAMLEVTAA